MRSLTVLYDRHCPLCRRLKGWLAGEPAYLHLEFLAAGSRAAEDRYPTLDTISTLGSLTVIDDAGGIYSGEDAYLMCLYALVDFRGLALSLSEPWGRPLLRAGAWVLDRIRGGDYCGGACSVPR